MKVKELIEMLQKNASPDDEVFVANHNLANRIYRVKRAKYSEDDTIKYITKKKFANRKNSVIISGEGFNYEVGHEDGD